jgi:hypothetical protein
MKDIVDEVNAELRKLYAEGTTMRESAFQLRILRQVIRVTDTDLNAPDPDLAPGPEGMKAPQLAESPLLQHGDQVVPSVDPHELQQVPHQHVPNIYGLCACGVCLHTQIGHNGICNTCGVNVVTDKQTDQAAVTL